MNIGFMKHKGAVINKSQVETRGIKIITIEINNFNEE